MIIMEMNNQSQTVNKPVPVSDSTFDTTIQENALVVVDFWAPWCGPCRMIAPVVEELAEKYPGKVLFSKLNVDENPITSRKYGVASIPTLLVMKEGEEVDRIVGFAPKPYLEQQILKYT